MNKILYIFVRKIIFSEENYKMCQIKYAFITVILTLGAEPGKGIFITFIIIFKLKLIACMIVIV